MYTTRRRIQKIAPDGTASTYVSGLATGAAGYLRCQRQSLRHRRQQQRDGNEAPPGGGSFSIYVDNTQGLNQPRDIVFDASGNMYVSNGGNNTISQITPGGSVTTFLDNSQGLLNYPYTLAFDSSGNLYIANAIGNTVVEIPMPTDQSPRFAAFRRQRGHRRLQTSGFALSLVSGDNQSATVRTAFATSLSVGVTPLHASDPVDGGQISFTARPASGTSARRRVRPAR